VFLFFFTLVAKSDADDSLIPLDIFEIFEEGFFNWPRLAANTIPNNRR